MMVMDTAGTASDGAEQTGPLSTPAGTASLPTRLRTVYTCRVGEAEQALMLSWAAFGATFGTAGDHPCAAPPRLRLRWLRGPDHRRAAPAPLQPGYCPTHRGRCVAVHGQAPRRRHPLTAAAYGAGAALALGGLYLAGAPFWHGAAREIARTRPST